MAWISQWFANSHAFTLDQKKCWLLSNQARKALSHRPFINDPEYHPEVVNVQFQQDNPTSLLRWIQLLISLRSKIAALGRGNFELVGSDNHKVLILLRKFREMAFWVECT